MKRAIAIILTLWASPALLHADSDGYFCTSDRYVAYEFNGISVPTKGHFLYIVHLGGKEGISEPLEVRLPYFQVHGMRCTKNSVSLLGWDKRFVVEITKLGTPKLDEAEVRKSGAVEPGFESLSLAAWSGPERISFPLSESERLYELTFIRKEDSHVTPGQGGTIYHEMEARIVEREMTGKVTKEKVLFKGHSEETVD